MIFEAYPIILKNKLSFKLEKTRTHKLFELKQLPFHLIAWCFFPRELE